MSTRGNFPACCFLRGSIWLLWKIGRMSWSLFHSIVSYVFSHHFKNSVFGDFSDLQVSCSTQLSIADQWCTTEEPDAIVQQLDYTLLFSDFIVNKLLSSSTFPPRHQDLHSGVDEGVTGRAKFPYHARASDTIIKGNGLYQECFINISIKFKRFKDTCSNRRWTKWQSNAYSAIIFLKIQTC